MANNGIGHLESQVADIQGQISGAKWIFTIVLSLITLLAAGWAYQLQSRISSGTIENRKQIEMNQQTTRQNEKAVERFVSRTEGQSRRLDRIEQDIKEIKEGQSILLRKLDSLILERSFRNNHP